MNRTTTAPAKRTIEIDDELLRRVLWAAAAASFATLILLTSVYALAAVTVGAAATLAAKSYIDNEVRRDFWVQLDAAWNATERALIASGLPVRIENTTPGVTEREVTAGDARVRIEAHPNGITRVRIRVGLFALPDNLRRAALIAERLHFELDPAPTFEGTSI